MEVFLKLEGCVSEISSLPSNFGRIILSSSFHFTALVPSFLSSIFSPFRLIFVFLWPLLCLIFSLPNRSLSNRIWTYFRFLSVKSDNFLLFVCLEIDSLYEKRRDVHDNYKRDLANYYEEQKQNERGMKAEKRREETRLTKITADRGLR